MLRLFLAVLILAPLGGCSSLGVLGTPAGATQAALAATYGERVASRLVDYYDGDADPDVVRLLEDFGFAVAMAEDESTATNTGLAAVRVALAAHDDLVRSDVELSESERAKALQDSERLLAILERMLEPPPPPDPEA